MGLRWPASTIVTGPGPPLGLEPAQEPRDLIERTLRGGQADALGRLLGELVQPFERQREVRAALGGRQGVDLVDDHPPDAAQGLASLRREHQVERLRRGDEDVGRVRHQRAAGRGPGCRRCARPPAARGRAARPSARRRAGCRRAGPAGSSRRRRPARAAARRRGRACAPWDRAAVRSPGGRSPTGTRPGSCPSRWGPGSGCGRRRRWPSSPAIGQAWARRTRPRTSRERWRRTRGGSPAHRTGNHRLAGLPAGFGPPVGCIRCRAPFVEPWSCGVCSCWWRSPLRRAARAQIATPSPTTAPGPTVAGAQDQVMLSGSRAGAARADRRGGRGLPWTGGGAGGLARRRRGAGRAGHDRRAGERFGDRVERPDPRGGDGLGAGRRAGCGGREGRTGRDDRRGRSSGRRVHAPRVAVGAGRLARRRRDRLLHAAGRPPVAAAGAARGRPGGERRTFGADRLRRDGGSCW